MRIEARQLQKTYASKDDTVPVLRDASIDLASGSCSALLGASGSGKSTFLQCLALLDSVSGGDIVYDGRSLANVSDSESARFRLENLGFVFQFHHLIPELTAEENVALPATLLGRKATPAAEILDWVGLGDKLRRYPWQLSGGEQQRVAVARALVNRPKVLLTDEATGNLDRERAMEIVELLLKVNREFGATVLSVTHDLDLAARFGHRYRLKDGQIWDWVEGQQQ